MTTIALNSDFKRDKRLARQRFGMLPPERLAAMIAANPADFRGELLMQCAAALLFGDSRGWELSNTTFGLVSVAQGHETTDEEEGCSGRDQYSLECMDHPQWYRRDGRPAAIIAHLYNGERLHPSCAALAKRFGVDFETPSFPSWWCPGSTTLVAYVGPAGREAKRPV
jgi:hypothetical protein